MEVLDGAAAVSQDGRAVVFVLSVQGREVECAVAREALEEYFWLQRDADATHILRTFANGRNRIVAMARRKVLARPHERVWLSPGDFAIR